jgi:hypothetical protein
MATIYRKSAKGHAEIETRAHRLPPRLRGALILVDGRRSDDEMRRMIPIDPDACLRTLVEQGFIEVIGITQDALPGRPVNGAAARVPEAAPSALPDPAAAAAPAASMSPQEFQSTRLQAVRLFTDLVGPMGEALALRMERARTPDELWPLVQTAQRVIGNTRGGQAATDFGARLRGSAGA